MDCSCYSAALVLLLFGLPLGFSSVDKSRFSKSAEVRRIWDVYDERLRWVDAGDALSVDRAIASGDVSGAWLAWSNAAEGALVNAFCRGFCLGRGLACFNRVRFGWA